MRVKCRMDGELPAGRISLRLSGAYSASRCCIKWKYDLPFMLHGMKTDYNTNGGLFLRKFFSTEHLFSTRTIVVLALMVALKAILGSFTIFLSPTFKAVTVSYLPGVMVSALYGPAAGLAFGFVADTVGYIVKPAGPYFVGYALSEMTTNFIFACFLYKKELRVWRVLLAQITNILVVFMGLNFCWNVIMYGSIASKYFTSVRIINYLLQLPIYVVLITICTRAAQRLEGSRISYRN